MIYLLCLFIILIAVVYIHYSVLHMGTESLVESLQVIEQEVGE